jgi:hypothetical protein
VTLQLAVGDPETCRTSSGISVIGGENCHDVSLDIGSLATFAEIEYEVTDPGISVVSK